MDILKERELIDKFGNLVLADQILSKTKYILFYFGAAWSDSSTEILPKLIEIYETSKNRELGLEIIFISSDNDSLTMRKYLETHGSWYAVLFDDILADELRWAYMVQHLPFLVVIGTDGRVISRNAYQEIMDYGKSVLVKWF